MSDEIKIDMTDFSSKPNIHDALEKLGRFAIKMKEQEASFQKLIQQCTVPDLGFKFDYDALRMTMDDYTIEPLIPEGYFEKTQEYQQKSLKVLQSINENTANLYTMVELINQNNEKQDELIALMIEILSLAKAKDKAEADTLFKRIMVKINDTAGSVDSMIKIMGWATTVYNMVLPMLK